MWRIIIKIFFILYLSNYVSYDSLIKLFFHCCNENCAKNIIKEEKSSCCSDNKIDLSCCSDLSTFFNVNFNNYNYRTLKIKNVLSFSIINFKNFKNFESKKSNILLSFKNNLLLVKKKFIICCSLLL